MTPQAKEARREYYRKYYQAHKAQRQEANRRYWERKADSQRKETEEKGKATA